ncbi:hypothetical protein [Halioxenophilus sp. WMMB6]|uniref:tautomerase family protein n=1 Tax=Halioxenophilus sp. WMMB6 TaxID=3073815 RepID=UPI00295EE6FF|nr:hypothetical protein [Halioxenophilus sp. WMMB6]
MPIVHFHVCQTEASEERCRLLVESACQIYARILDAPIERVRAFITVHKPYEMALLGRSLHTGDSGAPFFEAYVLRGRTPAQRQELMMSFTEILSEILSIDKSVVRGRCVQVDPEDWCIAGYPAADIRKDEIEARQKAIS